MADPHECGLNEAVRQAFEQPGVSFAFVDPQCLRDTKSRGVRYDDDTKRYLITGEPVSIDAMSEVLQYSLIIDALGIYVEGDNE